LSAAFSTVVANAARLRDARRSVPRRPPRELRTLTAFVDGQLDLIEQETRTLLADPTLCQPAFAVARLTDANSLHSRLDRLVMQAISVLHGQRPEDAIQARLINQLAQEAGTGVEQVAAVSVNFHFSTFKDPAVVFAPPGYGFDLATLPVYAHEFGHQLYATKGFPNLIAADAAIKNAAMTPPPTVSPAAFADQWALWLEEFFCDAIAAHVCGAAYARACVLLFSTTPYVHGWSPSHPSHHERVMALIDGLHISHPAEANAIRSAWDDRRALLGASTPPPPAPWTPPAPSSLRYEPTSPLSPLQAV